MASSISLAPQGGCSHVSVHGGSPGRAAEVLVLIRWGPGSARNHAQLMLRLRVRRRLWVAGPWWVGPAREKRDVGLEWGCESAASKPCDLKRLT